MCQAGQRRITGGRLAAAERADRRVCVGPGGARAGNWDGRNARDCPRAGLVEELEELGRGQACLAQDRGQGPALDRAVLGNHGHPPDGVASLDPHALEARGPQGARDIADRKVRQRRAHAAGSANEVTSGVLETYRAGSSTSSR